MTDWQRLFVLALLWPVFWLQGRYLRRVTPRMPEPPGTRAGSAGKGPLLRILVAGDSGAAGVGASTQDQALCHQLADRLSARHTVEWDILAINGLDSPGLFKLLESAAVGQFDVVILSIGANDATGLCSPQRWVAWQNQLAGLIEERFSPRLLVHSAVPPMHGCMALPQPLRWFMGHWAHAMNQRLEGLLYGQHRRTVHRHPPSTNTSGLAMDGFHPSPDGYARWADGLSTHIASALGPKARPPSAEHHDRLRA